MIYNSTTDLINSHQGGAWTAGGSGDVVGPASSTDHAVARFDSTTGRILLNSGVICDDSDNLTGIVGVTMSGALACDNAATFNNSEADKDFRVAALGITNALFVQGSDGNVGIGTTSPQAKFHISQLNPGANVELIVENTGTTADSRESFTFKNYDAGNNVVNSYLQYRMTDNTDGAADTEIRLYNTQGGVLTQAVTVDGSGNVGIGTTSPDSVLEVSGTSDVVRITSTATADDSSVGLLFNVDGTSRAGIRATNVGVSAQAGSLGFFTRSGAAVFTERLHIDDNGNVGIGTIPEDLLHIVGSGAGLAHFERTTADLTGIKTMAEFHITTSGNMTDGLAAAVSFIIEDDTSGEKRIASILGSRDTADNEGALIFRAGTDGAEEFGRFSHVGYYGLGTNDPDRLFHAEVSDAVTNAATYAQRLSHISSGDPLAGFGTGIEFELEENDHTNRIAGYIVAKWTDAGETVSASSHLDFGTMRADTGVMAIRMRGGPAEIEGWFDATPTCAFNFRAGADFVGFGTYDGASWHYDQVALDEKGNFGVGTTDQFGGGEKVIGLLNAATVPDANPTGGGVLYCEGGALKFRGSSGTITTIAAA